ncbi:3-oxoacyl-ACP synthase, partial [Escherichia coli]
MKIIGTGSALPVLAVTNDMIAEILDTSDEWISTRTGVKERRILSKETLTEIAVEAAKKAIQDANI